MLNMCTPVITEVSLHTSSGIRNFYKKIVPKLFLLTPRETPVKRVLQKSLYVKEAKP